MRLGEMKLDDAAKEAAGNWQHFECFWWNRSEELDNPDNWAILYTHHRDSGLLDQSNAIVIEQELKPFIKSGDVIFERHSHWAVGHLDGFSMRVFRRGHITRAFRKYHELSKRMANYPVLDEEDYSNREYDATLENLPIAAWHLKNEYELPEGWAEEVLGWFSANNPNAIENVDDQGGFPNEEELKTAFEVLGYEQTTAVL